MILFSLISLIAISLTLLLYLHKRSARPHSPISLPATVHTTLCPNGSVLVNGELWLAQSLDGKVIPERTEVTVTGLHDHLLLVTQMSDQL